MCKIKHLFIHLPRNWSKFETRANDGPKKKFPTKKRSKKFQKKNPLARLASLFTLTLHLLSSRDLFYDRKKIRSLPDTDRRYSRLVTVRSRSTYDNKPDDRSTIGFIKTFSLPEMSPVWTTIWNQKERAFVCLRLDKAN